MVLPRGSFAGRIEPRPAPTEATAEEIIRRALERPIGAPPLRELARGKRSAAILVSGQDRIAGAEVYLPLLLSELNRGGIPDDRIEAFLATGTHVKHTPAEAAALLGKETVSRVRFHEHDCNNAAALRTIGKTARGTEVALSAAVLEADVKVLTGRIIPHYFAGFSGGRKALVPGVAGFQTIRQNHRLMLAPERGLHPHIRCCRLDGNPVHLDMVEAARMVDSTFLLNTLLDTTHRMVGAVAGDMEAAHAAGCVQAERLLKVTIAEPPDALVLSPGGKPYDCNLTQALKALCNNQEIIRPGAAVLLAAQCPAGMKLAFLRWAKIESDDELNRAVRADYDLAGHNMIMMRAFARRARVALWSELPEGDVRALGFTPVRSAQEGMDWLLGILPKEFRYAVLPFGNVIHSTVKRIM